MKPYERTPIIDNITKKIGEMSARLEAEKDNHKSRVELMRYLEKNGYTRSDLYWAVKFLPLVQPQREGLKRKGRLKAKPKTKVGEVIRKARVDKGLTPVELAKMIGRHQTTINGWERGDNAPKKDIVQALADALGLPVVALHADKGGRP